MRPYWFAEERNVFYKRLGKMDVFLSVIAMGGHEYLASGLSRGFNEDFERAVQPGHIFEGFGQESRKQVLRAAIDNGINFFDVTMDSEKEALGRNLKEIKPPYEIYVQTRPESFGYTYDTNNVKLVSCSCIRFDDIPLPIRRGVLRGCIPDSPPLPWPSPESE